MKNIDIVKIICKELGKPESLITYVANRKGQDMRYAIDPEKSTQRWAGYPKQSLLTVSNRPFSDIWIIRTGGRR